jgi:hypothetical protein
LGIDKKNKIKKPSMNCHILIICTGDIISVIKLDISKNKKKETTFLPLLPLDNHPPPPPTPPEQHTVSLCLCLFLLISNEKKIAWGTVTPA